MKKLVSVLLFLSIFFGFSAFAKPKYGPKAIPLSQDHGYFKRALAPDYWALVPYYVAQQTGSACSIASVTMMMNAVRVGTLLTADDALVSQDSLLKKVGDDSWTKAVGNKGGGVTLDELGAKITSSLKAYGFEKTEVKVVHADESLKKESFVKMLRENEKSQKDFVVINFDQGVLTGDTSAGHIAPLAAYDAGTDRVLIMDPDREWFEPYWSKVDDVIAAMRTADSTSNKKRGYVRAFKGDSK